MNRQGSGPGQGAQGRAFADAAYADTGYPSDAYAYADPAGYPQDAYLKAGAYPVDPGYRGRTSDRPRPADMPPRSGFPPRQVPRDPSGLNRPWQRPEDGMPSPLLLTLHKDSSFTDMTYLTRQVFAFACHSWRTFLPGSVPVTIQYSDLIARTLGHLSLLDKWNSDVMLGRIGKTRWFL